MSDHTRPADQASPVRPMRRVNYFTGQVLTPEDFQAEQDYQGQVSYL